MANTFPLSVTAFADKLGIEKVSWNIRDQREFSGMGSGQTLSAQMGPSLWQATVNLHKRYHEDMAEVEALVQMLIDRSETFYLYDPRKVYPKMDPTGSVLTGYTPKVYSSSPSQIILKDLPAGFVISTGDFMSFPYAGGGRIALHRAVETVTVDGTGMTPAFDVVPFIQAGLTAETVVSLIKPVMRCAITPGSFQVSSVDALSSAGEFSVVQKP